MIAAAWPSVRTGAPGEVTRGLMNETYHVTFDRKRPVYGDRQQWHTFVEAVSPVAATATARQRMEDLYGLTRLRLVSAKAGSVTPSVVAR